MFVAVVVAAGCGGDDQVDVDAQLVDAAPVITDAAVDGEPPPVPMCTVAETPPVPPPVTAPVPGTYCVRWTKIDGSQDPFPRYYDRADVTAASVRWWASGAGGAKEYVAAAGEEAGCIVAAPFVAPGAVAGSGPVRICWSSSSTAATAIGWCLAGLADGHWTAALTACP